MEKHIWFAEFVERCGPFIDGAVFFHIAFRIVIVILSGR